jgi:hypothetical protein
MKRLILFFYCLLAFLAVSCITAQEEPVPPPEPVSVAEAEPVPAATEPVLSGDEANFNPQSVTQVEFDTTITDVRHFIVELNRIVRERDYNGWVAHLGPTYFAHISSPEYLLRISESSDRLKARGIVLSSARDYFIQVVVPSRANDRVDDIEFVTHRRVKAYTINAKGQRLRLYDLENVGNGWRIIN